MTVLRVDTIAGTGTTFGPTLQGDLEFNSQNYVVLPKGTSSQEGVLRNTADVVGTGGTYYDNLVLAMPFNEATGLLDVSSRNRNPGSYGNVAISTAQSKYYGSSAYFDGSGDYIDTGDSYDFAFGTGDWSVEFWIYPTSLGTRLIQSSTNSDNLDTGPDGTISYWNGSGNVYSASGTISVNNWFHIALVRYNGTAKIYVNGNNVATQLTTPNTTTPRKYWIGGLNSPIFNGYMQDFRFYKGIAKYTANFTPPERIAEVGVGFKTGQLRYNTDSNKVELYDGNQWTEVQSSRPDLNGGARGLWGGGNAPSVTNTIDYVTISSTGNALDFGDLTSAKVHMFACSSNNRGVWGGGYSPITNVIDYIQISSTGNAQDFGDLTSNRRLLSACSSSTRGIIGGGFGPLGTNVNILEYITIASTGNSVDFGDLLFAVRDTASCSSSVRGIFSGGYIGPGRTNTIQYVTISTLGNAQDFGDLISEVNNHAGSSNATRGIFGGTNAAGNLIQYITISTLGNAVNFGTLTVARETFSNSCASSIRSLWGGGLASGGIISNTIDYVTILTQGNAIDFGDLTAARNYAGACSNAHGGL